MRPSAGLTAVLVVALLLGCSIHGAVPEPGSRVTLVALYGTDPASLSLVVSGKSVTASLRGIGKTGSFCRIVCPEGFALAAGNPRESDGLLTAAFPTAGGVDIGVVPTSESHSTEVTVQLELGAPTRSSSIPPTGSVNRVRDLTVSELDPLQVVLEWTEVNAGDYDFNGEVNVADLSPIAKYFHQEYTPDPERPEDQTLYWIDGDKNGEVSLGDVTVLGINFGHQVSGYYILRNSVVLNEPDSEELWLVSRAGATPSLPSNPLPPLYSAVVEGTFSDSWSVVPVDNLGNQGSVSAGVVIGEDFDAKASVIINGINLWTFESKKEDSGFTAMWIIDPIDDVDWAQIGDKYVGPNGVPVFSGLPHNKLLFLDIAYAPKTDLLTGLQVTREDAIANPFHTRLPFTLPDSAGLVEFAPEIEITDTEQGLTIDLYAELETAEGVEVLRSRLLLPQGLVSYDTDGDASYIDQAFLADSNFDSVSNQRIRLLLDERAYEGGSSGTTLHRGTVKLFDEAAGYLVLSDALFWDEGFGGFAPVPSPGEIAYNFSELTEFAEPDMQFIDPSTISEGQILEVDGFFLSNLVEGLPLKYWAQHIERTN